MTEDEIEKLAEKLIKKLMSQFEKDPLPPQPRFIFQDAEGTITGWVEGQGKRIGTIGKFFVRDSNGNNFGCPVMEDFSTMRKMYEMADWYMGKVCTFTYFQRTPAGSYRHPQFKIVRDYE